MIKWPWKVQETVHDDAIPWKEALSIPLLTSLTEQEQNKLVTLCWTFFATKTVGSFTRG